MKLWHVAVVGAIGVALLLGGCSAPATVDSGIRGTVTLGPTSPVQQQGESGTEPYSADLVIKPQGGRSSVARVKSDSDGRFSAVLEPGTYVIRAASAQSPPSLKPVTVTVQVHQFTEVVVPFDSGIR
jgi:hypothetical protein